MANASNNNNNKLKNLGREILFFDGAMGTQLQARGLKLRELPESLNITHADLIRAIHRDYLNAGCDVITTNTFGANRFKLERGGLTVREAVESGLAVARSAAREHDALVALDIGPSGRVLAPLGDASFQEVYDSVAEQVQIGANACDLVLIETYTDLYEMKAAVLAAKENCDRPIFATMSFEASGRTFFGATVESAVLTLEGLGVAALGVNCSLGPVQLLPIVKKICEVAHVPVMVQPNAGLPVIRDGETHYDITPDEFSSAMLEFKKLGCSVLGGCCGTSPDHIKRMIKAVRQGGITVPVRENFAREVTAVCTPAQVVKFDDDFVLIGERLNPTGKKALQAALRANNMDFVLKEAVKQQDQGAKILDVNMGLPDIDEVAMLTRAVKEIQAVIDLPLQLDSSKPDALESAARIYNGKPLINSVNGKGESLATVLPIAKKYGACVLGLTLDDNGIPDKAADRLAVAKKIVDAAEKIGIPRRDILIDCLTLTASAQQELVLETLKAVRLIKEELGVKTVLGLSNVSFGLPRRPLVNRTMFAAALMQGLDAAIINPGDEGMRETLAAWRMLAGIDRDAQDYIAYCTAHPTPTAVTPSNVPSVCATPPSAPAATQVTVTVSMPNVAPVTVTMNTGQPTDAQANANGEKVTVQRTASAGDKNNSNNGELERAIARGLKDDAAALTQELLKTSKPLEIIECHIVPALDAVGRDYEAQKIFLPQLIKAADAAKAAFECLTVALESSKTDAESTAAKGPIIVCTVFGDVHDIGKNIVKTILENYNFRVIDLGKDVPPEDVVSAVREHNAQIVGLSALMTTTVASMKETIEKLHAECPNVKTIVGGAVLSQELAKFVGADFYARDAMESVRIAEQLCAN